MSVEPEAIQEARFAVDQMLASGLHAKIKAQVLRSDLTVLSGSGANIVVFDDLDGKLMIDSGFGISKPEVQASLSLISSRRVRYLVNTHFHCDHTDGNAWVHELGATIVAHTQTRLRLCLSQSIPAFRSIRPPSPKAALPTLTFDRQMSIELKKESVLLKRYTPAHTDSDIGVYFERLDILHAGDTWFNNTYPFIDYDGGGSIDGLIAATRENLDLAGPRTLVVPGHGDVGTRDDLVEFYNMLLETRSRVAELKASGFPIDAVLASKVASRFEAKYGEGFIPQDLFVSMVYRGV